MPEWIWSLMATAAVQGLGIAFFLGTGSARLKGLENQVKGIREDMGSMMAREEACNREFREADSDLHNRITDVATRLARVQGRLNGHGSDHPL